MNPNPEPRTKKAVWKFQITSLDQIVRMPFGADIVRVAYQDTVLCMWAVVDPALMLEDRHFAIFGTGHDVPMSACYWGSACQGPFVWHLFELQVSESGE